MNTRPKYVASRTLKEPLEWKNSRLLRGDVATDIRALKETDGGNLLVIGSSDLMQRLMVDNLVDEFRVMIDPVVLGGGKRIYRDDGRRMALQLTGSQTTLTGAILATYIRITSD